MSFAYSRGTSKRDNYPKPRTAADLRAFAKAVLADRQRAKGQGYICGPLNGDGRRCKDGALPRRWLAADLDGIDPAVHTNFRLWMARRRGFGWPTANSTPQNPRERIIMELTRPVTRDEGILLGRLFAADLADEFGSAIELDESTFRAEQPCYLPVGDVTPFHLDGEPIDVDTWLERMPPEADTGPRDDSDAADWLSLLTTGENVHEGALRLVGRMVGKGMSDAEIRAWFEGVAGSVAKVRGEARMRALLGEELQRMLAGARGKGYGDDADEGAFVGPAAAAVGLAALQAEPYIPPDVVEGLYPRDAGVIVAPGESGKTTMALYEAPHLVIGRQLYGHRVAQPGGVLIVTAEDSRATLIGRLNSICSAMELSAQEIDAVARRVFIEDISERPVRLMTARDGRAERTAYVEELVERYEGVGLAMLHIDPLSLVGPGEELGNDGMAEMMRTLRHLSRRLGCCVRAAHHTGKEVARNALFDQYAGRGASAIADNARFIVQLARIHKRNFETPGGKWAVPAAVKDENLADGVLLLMAHKHSYRRRRHEPIVLVRGGFAFDCYDAIRAGAGGMTPQQSEAQLLADCVAVTTFLGQQPRRYSRKRLEEALQRIPGGMTRTRLRDAVSQLLASGALYEIELPKADQRGGFKSYLSVSRPEPATSPD